MGQTVKYINSKGVSMDLTDGWSVRIRKKTAGFYAYEYTPDVTALAQGVRVDRMTKGAAEYDMIIDFTGTPEGRAYNLQKFFEVVDYDVAMLCPGKLYVGDQYIEGYIIKSDVEYYEDRHRTLGKRCTLYAPYPYWIEDKELRYRKIEGVTSNGIEFAFDWHVDLGRAVRGTSTVVNTHYIPSSFVLTFFGPATNPSVTIGGNVYRVNTTVLTGEHLRIDSSKKTVVKHTAGGSEVNEYNNRYKASSIFKPIQPGVNLLAWTGDFSFNLMLHQERGELKWI